MGLNLEFKVLQDLPRKSL